MDKSKEYVIGKLPVPGPESIKKVKSRIVYI